MAIAELKTKKNDASVSDFINKVKDPQKKADAEKVLKLMQKISGEKPKMWGSSIVGFGTTHYKYASGREGDWMKLGFSPRAAALTLYGLIYYDADTNPLLKKLGKYKSGKGCLYINKLADIDEKVLEQMIKEAYKTNHYE